MGPAKTTQVRDLDISETTFTCSDLTTFPIPTVWE